MPKKISDLIAKLRQEMPELADNETLDQIEVAAYSDSESPDAEADASMDVMDESGMDESGEALAADMADESAEASEPAEAEESDAEEMDMTESDFPMPKFAKKKPKRQLS